MGLAFAMAVLLVVPNPTKIRMALRAQRKPPLLPYERTLLTRLDQTETESEPEAAPVKPIEKAVSKPTVVVERPEPVVPEKTVAEKPPVETSSPVRVASADPTASLGLIPQSAPPVPQVPAVAPAPMPTAIPLKPVAPENTSLSIPVPDPIQRMSQSTSVKATVPPPFPQSSESVQGESESSSRELLTSHGAEVQPGSRADTWSFRFEETPLPVVLKLLASRSGSAVIVDPSVSANFTGQFADTDPAQALAVVVKTHRLSVSRRGNYLLIGHRPQNVTR
ncbi:hypothetical protein SAMN05421753_108232 [Planctomicrobium piriforme]|uniref:Uncharacterized protein n=2 Tax=Planctomicrobium piriforme TaxID=1576369 RepID=A0A1I3HY08_9PLAN|nr:hypothetical protein SAMN05421753_108232 [Planctomicrobium piriforme]